MAHTACQRRLAQPRHASAPRSGKAPPMHAAVRAGPPSARMASSHSSHVSLMGSRFTSLACAWRHGAPARSPCTMHHAPCTMHHPAPCTADHATCTMHHAPLTMHHAPCTWASLSFSLSSCLPVVSSGAAPSRACPPPASHSYSL